MIVLTISILLVIVSLPGTLQLVFLTTAALLPKRPIPHTQNSSSIRIALVIPAHNEETCIGETLTSVQACHNAVDNESIYVIADNCTDTTSEIAAGFGVQVFERSNDTLRGKGYALNFAFSKILKKNYDAIVVIDADTTVDTNLFDTFRDLFADGESAGQAKYRVKNADAGIRPRLMNIAFLAFNYLRPLGRDNVGLSVGILGNGFGLTTALIKKVPYDSFSIVEDLEYHLRLISSGHSVRFLSNTTVWSDMPVSGADAQSQRERWEGGRLRMLSDHVPGLIRKIGKGQFALIEPLFEMLLLPLVFHVVLIFAILLIAPTPLKFYALVALGVVILHVAVAMIIGKASWSDWKALASAPFYILWKLSKLGGILRTARKKAAWKRTRR